LRTVLLCTTHLVDYCWDNIVVTVACGRVAPQPLSALFLQVTYGTWFGANVEFIHGIQVGIGSRAQCHDCLSGSEPKELLAWVSISVLTSVSHVQEQWWCMRSSPDMLMQPHTWLLQMLPFTPISEQLLTRDWVATEYPIVAKALPTAAQGWKVRQQVLGTSTVAHLCTAIMSHNLGA
jgi:hypothetical protein